MKQSKKQSKKQKRKSNLKKSSKNYDANFTEKELYNINKNFLVNSNSVFKSEKEVLYSNGFFTKNEGNNMYVDFDHLSRTSIDFAGNMIYLLAPSLATILIQLYKEKPDVMSRIIHKNFKRLIGYFDINSNLTGDAMIQMKLLKYILNENIFPRYKVLPVKKIMKYLDEIMLYRNQLSHQVYRIRDYEKQTKKTKQRKRSNFHQKHKLRNFNVIKGYITKIQFIINEFYKNRDTLKFNFDTSIFNKYYILLDTVKKNLDYLCLMRERRKKMEILIKDEDELVDIANSTLDFLNKSLNNKSKKKKLETARNIVNIITTRMESDAVFKKYFGDKISNKSCKSYCDSL